MEKFDWVLGRLRAARARYLEIEEILFAPETIADNRLYLRLNREFLQLKPLNELYDLMEIATDSERENLLIEAENLLHQGGQIQSAQVSIKSDDSLFCSSLFAMLNRLCDSLNLDFRPTGECSFIAEGIMAFERLFSENGIHKSPVSTAFVTVLPIISPKTAEFGEKDVRIDLFHSGGAGGQNVNKVQSAVRITHLETKIFVVCQDSRSQLDNRNTAMKNLRKRVEEYYQKLAKNEAEAARKTAEKTSGRVRLYPNNYGEDWRV